MSLPITTITKNADQSWTFTWASTGAAMYRIVLFGEQLDQTTDTSWIWRSSSTYKQFPPPIEVSDSTLVLSEIYQPYLIIQWYGEAVENYLVQFLSTDTLTWQTISSILEVGQAIYSYQTKVLQDETTYQFRVIAVDSFGNQSPPRAYTIYVVTPPTPPSGSLKFTYNSPNVVVDAA